MTQKLELPLRLQKTEQVEQWWKLLLRLIAQNGEGVLPHTTLIPCRLAPDGVKKLKVDAPLIPSLIVRAKMPYDRVKNLVGQDAALLRAFMERVKAEIESMNNHDELARAMMTRRVRKIRLELIDTGKRKGGGSSNVDPKVIAEGLLV